MSDTVHSPWSHLLDQYTAAFLSLNPRHIIDNIPHTATVDGYLRLRLEALGQQKNDWENEWPLARLRYERVNVFARAIDRALAFEPPINLAGLICFAIYITVESTYQRGVALSSVVDLLNRLDHALPRVNYIVPPEAPQLHDQLRSLFHHYASCLVDINKILWSVDPLDTIYEITLTVRCTKDALGHIKERLKAERRELYNPEHNSSQSQSSDGKGWHLDQLDILGRGSFGTVYKAIERTSGQIYALKKIPFGENRESRRRVEAQVQNECKIMRKLPHLHIVNVCLFYEDEECWNIIMDVVAEWNLRDFLDHCCRTNFQETRRLKVMLCWFGCLIDALNFAHRAQVIHNDIKPANILILGDTVYLADFGLSIDSAAMESSRGLEYTPYGTSKYKAPELARGEAPRRRADVFSLGCVFSEMLTVHGGYTLDLFREHRSQREATVPEPFRNTLPAVEAWLSVLRENGNGRAPSVIIDQTLWMIEADPNRRPTAEHVRYELLRSQYRRDLFCNMHE
ncbi:kinase-like domain-containing protein [Aspergillus pseudoustus]|uniref:Kinase-like domain-containing protein n=1 Tax=Aspergillus pseudoustus TaxID=1810923 RepID=A0ABR4JI53_9EURO